VRLGGKVSERQLEEKGRHKRKSKSTEVHRWGKL
jgi:hypothetical protein